MSGTLDEKIRFLWLDVETTGLVDQADLLLEVAWWPTRSADPFDLAAEDARSMVIHHDGAVLGGHLSPFTWRMHTANGLLPEVIESKFSVDDVAYALARTLGVNLGVIGEKKAEHAWHLAGNSVHFDRGFLRVDCHQFARLLSHRHLDVTSLLLAARACGLDIPKEEPAHRAMDDVKQSIRLAAKCMFVPVREDLEQILAEVR